MEKNSNSKLDLFQAKEILKICSTRENEKKIGETMFAGSDFLSKSLESCPAQFVILGIPEDVGPRANCGKGGSESAWEAFLTKFINIQETNRLKGSSIILLGAFDFTTMDGYEYGSLKRLREIVSAIDESVSALIERIVKAGKTPIVIGGGHNNCYGLLKGTSTALGQSVNCINLDPHADYRALEGRHSGNGFSYAKQEGYLDKYSIVGLHENYNSQEMIDRMEQDLIDFSTYEAIFLREEIDYLDAVDISLTFVGAEPFGIELDCDAIENFPSSAQTPSGISSLQARQYIHNAGRLTNAKYLHLPEAAPSLVEGSEQRVGKMLSYLVSDFIKAKSVT
jgi:formiminoglutamase